MRTIIFYLLFLIVIPCCNNKRKEVKNTDVQLPQQQKEIIEKLDGNGLLVGINRQQIGLFNEKDTITCDFLFINQGSEPVKIIEHTVSCDCSELRYNGKDIMVKDTVIISMVIHTKGKNVGNHSSVAVIKTNGKRRFYDITAYYSIAPKNE